MRIEIKFNFKKIKMEHFTFSESICGGYGKLNISIVKDLGFLSSRLKRDYKKIEINELPSGLMEVGEISRSGCINPQTTEWYFVSTLKEEDDNENFLYSREWSRTHNGVSVSFYRYEEEKISIGVVGLGLMGCSITTCLLMAGHVVKGIHPFLLISILREREWPIIW